MIVDALLLVAAVLQGDSPVRWHAEEILLVIPPAEKPFPDWKGPLPVFERPRRPRPTTPVP